MKGILKYIKPYILQMVLGLIIKFTGTIMDLCLPWILAYMIDDIIPKNNVNLIFIYGVIMVICSIIAVTNNIIANRMASRVARDVTREIRHDLFVKISYFSNTQIDKYTIPSLISRMTSDTYNIQRLIGVMQRLGVRAPILLIGGVIVTLTLEPVLSLVLIATLPFVGIMVYYVSKKGVPYYSEFQMYVDKLVRIVRENIIGIRVIKALSKTEYEKSRFEKINKDTSDKEKKASIVMGISSPMMNLILNLGLSIVIIVGAFRVNSGTTEPGKIVAFLTYFTIILNAMLSITRMFVLYSKGSASAMRISEVLEEDEDIVIKNEDYIESKYHIEFNNVSFSYNKDVNAISNINFKLKRGETLGIIGATGSGKTTIIKLLMKFYEVDEGKIRINGYGINGVDKNELHKKFGVAFQNDMIFENTIYENIKFGRDLRKEDIFRAAEYAQAKEFIENLREKYNEHLTSKGSNLSGGQKQRVLISRALAKKPEILILDDSSSALDYKTDSLLRKAINDNFKDTTTIIVAQRISSIKNADKIIVLEEGKIIGYGNHDELIKDCYVYKEISDSQMGGDIGEN
nr:ABC transporter ATP-binding protein [Clostridium neonatale]